MKVFVQLDAREGASVEEFQTPDNIAEEKLVWKYWSEGTLRDINFQTDRIGVILIFEADTVAEVSGMVNAFPFVRSGLLKVTSLQQLAPFVGLAALFDPAHFA
ncbi:hypothetical protein FHR22_002343 [Sphingopyxis panaciterrae]|uniref:hypothetical protein n=1 Tax=Sphingopyxis panaciterrae TaxID=363841 RepID=UPI00141F1BD3|nr:hypothetical protein [Sphingopyxis panaciterrae]NIJ37659.1 hypothetical protein [Sphingopyxis panaciterrae]